MKLSIIVPVYNEVRTIKKVIERLQVLTVDNEIIVVDDGSTDGTAEVLAAVSDQQIRRFSHSHNQGKGAAVRTGLQHTTGELVIIQDADLEYNPADYARLMAPIEQGRARVVYGSRFLNRKRLSGNPYYLANRFLTWLTNVLYGSSLTDMETCYKLFRREALSGIEIKARRFDIEPEITAKLLRRGEKIYEVPITYLRRGRGEGKKIGFGDGVQAVLTLAKYRFFRK